MITRITLDNYMSHAHTVIEPAAGLTVILGPNNCGKSAIVSALQTLCGDHSGDFMLRHGEKECAVTVETDDGHVINWRRGKKVGYVLDGVEVERVGRGNLPDDLQTLLRLGKVAHPSKEDVEFDVHFGEQKSPIFLIDRQADTAAFFSTVSDAEKLLEMQKLHKTRQTDKRRQLAETKGDLAVLAAELTALAPLDELLVHVESAKREAKEVEALEQAIVDLGESLDQILWQEQRVEFHRRAVDAIAPMHGPPELADIASLESLTAQLEQTLENVARQSKTVGVLSPLASAPNLIDVGPLSRDLDRLTAAKSTVARAAARQTALEMLADPPVRIDTKPLEEFSSRLNFGDAAVKIASARQAALMALYEPPAINDPIPLQETLSRLSAAAASRVQHHQQLNEVTKQLSAIEEDMNAWLWANPNCPTCGQPTSREHFLSSHDDVRTTLFPIEGDRHA